MYQSRDINFTRQYKQQQPRDITLSDDIKKQQSRDINLIIQHKQQQSRDINFVRQHKQQQSRDTNFVRDSKQQTITSAPQQHTARKSCSFLLFLLHLNYSLLLHYIGCYCLANFTVESGNKITISEISMNY